MSGAIELLLAAEAAGIRLVRSDDPAWGEVGDLAPGIVRVGVHVAGVRPCDGLDAFDVLLSVAKAPAPWVMVADVDAEAAHLEAKVSRQPLAAAILAQVLRITLALDFGSAILLESLAYSTLLASGGFRCWRQSMTIPLARADAGPRVRMERVADRLEIILNRPRGRNAVDAAMRDALVEALEFACLDPERAPLVLRGEGAVFSIGGDLAEFGQADDPAAAHAIRALRSPARALHAVRHRATAQLHGPCIGAGIEIPAAAGRISARAGTSFRLPEVEMGLIPGAGGTATIARRIGRHRTCWLALSGHVLDLATAHAWGLVDTVEP